MMLVYILCCCRTKQLILFWLVLLQTYLLINSDVTSPTANRRDYELCKRGETLKNYALRGGRKAGAYYKIGKAANLEECIDLCCSSEVCHLAIFVKNSCYSVECENADLCKPIKVHRKSKMQPSIFRRYRATFNHERDSSLQLPDISGSNVTLKREKRYGSCQQYTGKTCKAYLDKDRLIYYDETPSVVEHRLSGPFTVIQGHFNTSCKKYALPALCLTSFPYCVAKPHPQPVRLCREDCERLYEGICKHDFNLAKKVAKKYPPLLKIMPNCLSLVDPAKEGDDCVKLGLNEEEFATAITTTSGTSNIHLSHDSATKETTPDTQRTKQPENDIMRTHQTTPQVTSSIQPSHEYETEFGTRETTPGIQHTKHTENGFRSLDRTTPKVTSALHPSDSVTTEMKSSTKENEQPIEMPTNQLPTDTDNVNADNKTTTQPGFKPTDVSPIHVGKHKIGGGEWSNQSETSSYASEIDQKARNYTFRRTDTLLNKTSEISDQKEGGKYSTSFPSTISPNKVGNQPMELLASVLTTPKQSSSIPRGMATGNLSSASIAPTIVSVNGSEDGLDLEAINKENRKVPTSSIHLKDNKIKTKAPGTHLHVSTVGDKEIILPKDTASLYASAWPKETTAYPYSYQWLQIAAPKNSHGYMEGKNAQRVVLTQLTKPGVYQFKVVVRAHDQVFGRAFVNVTVKNRQRVNKPPRADISPKEQVITLPTNEVVLDGSKSSDDDKIVGYKWQELKGPLTEKDKTIKSGVNSPILQLKSLLPGVYTYKLTVKDSDGETDSTVATVTVNAEKDYPPVARAGNDVVITLPENYVTLYGNGSTDDHGVKSYEWSKSPLSPTCDLQGSTEPILHVSNMVAGDYTFTLKVTDTGDHNTESKVMVVVRPEKNAPPIAKAGDDKDLVYPDGSTTLNAKESHDDQGISRYHWEKISGPSSVEMSGVDKMILSLSHLTEGHYVFKVTVYDSKGLTGTDSVSVNVKRDGNQPPHADAGPDVLVKLPNRAAALDGSKSSDDYHIVKYSWTRYLKSPAAGDIINGSNHQPILRLSNLVKGVYRFQLTVKDAKGLETSDDAKIIVKEDENSPSLIELYLDVDVTSFTEENKRQLVRKLAVSLNVLDSDIVIEHIQPSGRGNSLVVLFYVKDGLASLIRDGQEISDLLKQKLRDNFFEFKMEEVEPYVCRNNCSGHGYCDQHTKQCICESFWMQDPFKANFGLRDRNCDWSILYVIVIIFGVIVAIVGITWGVCFCLGRTKTRRTRNQYSIVGDEDSDDVKNTTMDLYPRGKYLNSSIMSETDMDTDEETLFENKKPYKGSRTKLNGIINGHKSRHT